MQQKSAKPCSFFQQGRCTKGAACNFSHSVQAQQPFGAQAAQGPSQGQAFAGGGGAFGAGVQSQGRGTRAQSSRPQGGGKPCNYGLACRNQKCNFQHPQGWQPGAQGNGNQSLPQIGNPSNQQNLPQMLQQPNQFGQQAQQRGAAGQQQQRAQTCANIVKPPIGQCQFGPGCPNRHNFALAGVTNLFLANQQPGLNLHVVCCREFNGEFHVSAQSVQKANFLYRINAQTGQLVDQIQHLPQNYEVTDFIPLGQRGMVLVVSVTGQIFYWHLNQLSNNQNRVHAHQDKLLGFCQDEQQGLIYSVGSAEPVIKAFQVENTQIKQVQQIQCPQQIQMTCMARSGGNMLIGTTTPGGQIINVVLSSIGQQQPQIQGISLAGVGGRQPQPHAAITKMHVSADGQYLAVLDSNQMGAVYRTHNLSGQRAIASHKFGQTPPQTLSVFSGAQPDQYVLVGGCIDGTIQYLFNGLQPQGGGPGNLARGKVIPDPQWVQGHPDQSRQMIVAVCDLKHCTPSGDQVITTVDQAGEVKIWQLTF